MKATGTFKITSWDEKPCDEGWDGARVTRASVTQNISGDVEGEARLEYVMTYCTGGSASYVVTIRVAGKLDGRSGGFVAEGRGNYADGTATCDFTVVSGAGSGELTGLRGTGSFTAKHAEYPNVPFTFDYHFE
ncbi:MAG TPA: DUF3224 domain-containing protein [Blastocatellia bacterium]|nr:DUF3224 domain-containing protein [Blastocatellia bacterium]